MNEIMYSKSLSEEIYCELGKINYRRKRNWLHYGYMFITKWKSEINIDINFDNVFLIFSLVTNNIKVKQFQFKLFHQMLPTQIFSKIGTKNVDLCSFCKCITDSILHYTWLCPIVKSFWEQVKTWLGGFFAISIEFDLANTGFIEKINDFQCQIIEFFIIFTNYYLHVVR